MRNTTPTHIQTEDRQFVREMNSKALLTTDKNALVRHRRQYAKAKENDKLRDKCERLEQRLEEIVTMIRGTAQGLTHTS